MCSSDLRLSCQGTPVHLACSRQSNQLAWLADTGAQNGAYDTHTPAILGQQALSVRSSLVRQQTRLQKLKIQANCACSSLQIGLESLPIRRSQNILIFESCLQSAGSYLRCCHIYCITVTVIVYSTYIFCYLRIFMICPLNMTSQNTYIPRK